MLKNVNTGNNSVVGWVDKMGEVVRNEMAREWTEVPKSETQNGFIRGD